MSDELNYHEIDANRLDIEWIRHVKFYHLAATKLAEARADHEALKTQLEIVDAELDRDIRSSPEAFGLSKITEGVVSQTILLQQVHQKADNKTREARHKVNIHQVEVDTLEHRKRALEKLVELRLADYFSEPRTPKGVNKADVDDALYTKKPKKPVVRE